MYTFKQLRAMYQEAASFDDKIHSSLNELMLLASKALSENKRVFDTVAPNVVTSHERVYENDPDVVFAVSRVDGRARFQIVAVLVDSASRRLRVGVDASAALAQNDRELHVSLGERVYKFDRRVLGDASDFARDLYNRLHAQVREETGFPVVRPPPVPE